MAVPTRGLALAALLTAALAGCGGAAGTTSATTQRPTPSPTPPPTAVPTPLPTPVPAQTLPRPVIVQVENAPDARPQSGLSAADIVIEYEVEGGLSRFSAVFLNDPPGQVGPVRSARTITVQLTTLYSAALLFSGADDYVLGLLRGELAYDETSAGGDLFRVASRAAPHNLYTDGGHMTALLRHVKGGSALALPLRDDPAVLPPGGAPAARVLVPVSFGEQPAYTWDANAGGWLRTEPGTGQAVDANTGKPWAAPTVVVLHVPVTTDLQITDAAGVHGLDHAIKGSGAAEILAGGRLYNGKFIQGASGLPVVTLADGGPAPIAHGQIVVIYTRQGLSPRIVG